MSSARRPAESVAEQRAQQQAAERAEKQVKHSSGTAKQGGYKGGYSPYSPYPPIPPVPVRKDRAQLGLDHVTPSDRNTWAGTLRSAVRQDPPLITRDKCPV